MPQTVDEYLIDGCGRCPLGGTPECKVHSWEEELKLLRAIMLDCGLTEEIKWGCPCYTYGKSNVLMVSALKDCATVGFFKGALLKDTEGILSSPGENSQAVKQVRFTNVQDILKHESTLKAYIFEAIELEKAGVKVDFKAKDELEYPEELLKKFAENPELEEAFKALTPGRQRGYILHFSQPKKPETREARIDKFTPMILQGKGMHDDYKKMKK